MTALTTTQLLDVLRGSSNALIIGVGEFVSDSLTICRLSRNMRMYNINCSYHKNTVSCVRQSLTAERTNGWVWVSSLELLQCFVDTALEQNADLCIVACNKQPAQLERYSDVYTHYVTVLSAPDAAKLLADGVDIREI